MKWYKSLNTLGKIASIILSVLSTVTIFFVEAIAKVNFFVEFSPLPLNPFPPMGAREVVAPQ